VDDLEEQAYIGPSLGLESQSLDAMTNTLGVSRIWMFPLKEREDTFKEDCDIPQNKIFWKFNFLGNYFVFGKFEFGIFFPFMAIMNSEFVNCNKLL